MKTQAENQQAGFTLLEFIVALVIAAIMAAMVYTYFGNALTQSSVPIFRLQNASKLHQVMENIVADYDRLNAINLRAPWKPNFAYNIGDVVVAVGDPTSDGKYGFYYKCTQKGTSAASEPPWSTLTSLNTVTDNTAKWARSDYGSTYALVKVWQPATSYSVNQLVVPSFRKNNGHYYICTRLGSNTTTTEPTWPTTTGGATTGATSDALWQEIGTMLEIPNYDATTYHIENMKTNLLTTANYGSGFTAWTLYENIFTAFDSSNPRQETTATERNVLKVTIKNNDSAETLTELFTIR